MRPVDGADPVRKGPRRPSGHPLLPIGRERELARLHHLCSGLRAGQGGSVVVHGEAGIGKTMLLEVLLADVESDFTVLRAAGVQSEAEIAFAGLSDLLTPALGRLEAIPPPQAAALAGAVAIGPPHPGDRLAVCVATLGLVLAAAERRPVLAVVDDLQWLDPPSRECLLFAARRVSRNVVFVMAARDENAWSTVGGDLPALRLGRLGETSSLKLLQQRSPDLSGRVARVVAETAAGNPLALVELPDTLTAAQRSGLDELVVPPTPGVRWRSIYATRAASLPEQSRRVLLVAALYRGDDLQTLARACAHAGTEVARLDDAEDKGLVRLHQGRVLFVHPLVRGVVTHEASGSERRRAHGALALALAGEARAWHRAGSVIGPDESVAAELERAAVTAASRRGFASAVSALERAARLSPRNADQGRRMLSAGQTAAAAGMPVRAMTLFDAALAAPIAEEARGQVQHARGAVMLWMGEVEQAGTLLCAEAERIAQHDPVRAATMLVDAATARAGGNDLLGAERLGRRAVVVLDDAGDALDRAHVFAVLGWVLALRGHTSSATEALAEAACYATDLDPLVPGRPWLNFVLRARIPQGDLATARSEGMALCDRARAEGAMSVLASTLVVTADAAFRLGDWDVAEQAAAEAIAVAQDSQQQIWHGYALVVRAALAAARGDEELSRRCADSALEIASSEGVRGGLRFCYGVRGFLALSFERTPQAIAALEDAERLVVESGLEEPTLVPWPSDLIEAYLRAGQTTHARRVLSSLTRRAEGGPSTARMLLHRCRGLMLEEYDAAFLAALDCDDECPMPFERARTLLAYGRRLHRARRRREGRVRLREALEGFEALGARPWADQARRELEAAGARQARPRQLPTLSAQEWRVAETVARGMTNKQAAAELFLSPKTIEFHLDHVYRKLDIHSRMGLAAALDRESDAHHEPHP